MKTNFSSGRVSGHVSFSFDEMKTLNDMFENAALDAATSNQVQKAQDICMLADTLGLSVEVEVPDFTGEGQVGQDSTETE